jgi:hypothetical protein
MTYRSLTKIQRIDSYLLALMQPAPVTEADYSSAQLHD